MTRPPRGLETELVVEQLECRIGFGRSSRYGFRRHAVMRAGEYEKLLKSRNPAVRGRALRMLGRKKEARAAFRLALSRRPGDAAARAWRWELGLADAVLARRVDFSDIDRAVALEPREPIWRVWRGIGRLSFAPYSSTRRLDADEVKRLRSASEAALEDFRAALSLDRGCALARVAQALAFENLKRWDDMLAALDRAVRLEPREGWLRVFRSVIKANMGVAEGFGPDDEAAIYLDEGYPFAHFAQGRTEALTPDRLVEKADAALRRAPGKESWWIYVFRAENRRAPPNNDFSGAVADFEKAVALKPGCSWAWAYFAKALAGGGRLKEAVAAIDRAVRLHPRCGWFWIWRGEIRRRCGLAGKALRDFDRGLALDPDYELGYAWRGGARRAEGDLKGALADLELACRLDPRHPWTTYERALVLRALGRIEESMDALEAACRLDPKFGWCRDRRAAAEAIAPLDRFLRAHPRSARALGWRGEAKLSAGDLEGARRDLERSLALEPGRAWARAWLGRTLFLLGKRGEARRQLDRAVALDGSYANARAWRGGLKLETGDFKGALADLEAAAGLDPKSAWILEWRGRALLSLGRKAEAARDFRLSLELNPRSVDALYWEGRTLCELGRCAEARRAFDRALALEPRHVWALIASGVCLEKSGRVVEGGRRLAAARGLSPELFDKVEAAA